MQSEAPLSKSQRSFDLNFLDYEKHSEGRVELFALDLDSSDGVVNEEVDNHVTFCLSTPHLLNRRLMLHSLHHLLLVLFFFFFLLIFILKFYFCFSQKALFASSNHAHTHTHTQQDPFMQRKHSQQLLDLATQIWFVEKAFELLLGEFLVGCVRQSIHQLPSNSQTSQTLAAADELLHWLVPNQVDCEQNKCFVSHKKKKKTEESGGWGSNSDNTNHDC